MKNLFRILGVILLILSIILINSCKKDKPTPPVLTTTAVTSITYTTAMSGGDATSEGGAPIVSKGVCWNTSADPTIDNSETTESGGLGSFASNLTLLTPNTLYYVRAYATNSAGTGYGNQVSFTTIQVASPVLTTTAITSITQTTAISGGNITADNGGSVTARGVCWGTVTNPTTANNKTTDGTGTGSFVSNLTGLQPGTIYYAKSYATNSAGTSYGNEISFTTLPATVPTLTTAAVSSITGTTATSGGNVTSDGGASVTSRGVCWSTTVNPDITGSKTSNSTGTGSFVSNITGLTPGSTYYVRAYATNSVGTAYGNQLTFSASAMLPTITTTSVSSITATTASSGGNVTADGGATITARGICFGTTANPTITNTTVVAAGTTGTYTCNITGLTTNTTYYIRAYATNSVGTAYGNEVSFTSLLPAPTITNFPAITKNYGDASFTLTQPNSNSTGLFTYSCDNTGVATISGSTVTITGVGISVITATQSATTSYASGLITATLTVNAILPTLTTASATNIAATTATSGGNITSNGGATITISGVCWNTSQNPVATDSHTTNGSTTVSFVSSLTGLTVSTTYYVRAYATNSAGTAYGANISFTTTNGIPLAPTGVSTSVGNGQVTISWSTVSDATSYNTYWSTTTGVTKTNGTKITGATSPYIHTGRTNGTTYYYVVTAQNSYGESSESNEVNATPVAIDTGFGGTATQYVSNGITYAVHTFTLSTNFHPPTNLTHARVLLVGGGGNGGGMILLDDGSNDGSGGGGGGGEVKDIDIAISGTTMAVVVGAAGTSSSFGGQTAKSGLNGSNNVNSTGGNGGASGDGHDGGIGYIYCGGGGGGASWGFDGIPGTWNPMGGKGGDGGTSDITGFSTYYGGGGGGGTWVMYDGHPGTGGAGGGGGFGGPDNGIANTGVVVLVAVGKAVDISFTVALVVQA